jgi:ubiquinone/menaquinone biosynthesis C-methylase UbiE
VDYEKETRLGYRDLEKVRQYDLQQTRRMHWMRLSTWRERRCVLRGLKTCVLSRSDRVLDVPCGSGIMASVLNRCPARIFASDISAEMIHFARTRYSNSNFLGFSQSDITRTPYKDGTFGCVLIIGILHRLPSEIREQALREATRISQRYVIASFSVDTSAQRYKKRLLQMLWPSYRAAPAPLPPDLMQRKLRSCGLVVKEKFRVVPFLSAEEIYLLERADVSR